MDTMQGFQTTALEASSSGRIDILSIMKKQYIYKTFVDLVECNYFETITSLKMSGPRTAVQ